MSELKINKFVLYWILTGSLFCFTILPKIWYAITYTQTTGVVRHFVYIKNRNSRASRVTWYPIVDFFVDKKKYSFYGSDLEHDEFHRGDTTLVLYNSTNPIKAYVYSFPGFWGPSLVYFIPLFIVFSGVLLSVGFLPKILVLRI